MSRKRKREAEDDDYIDPSALKSRKTNRVSYAGSRRMVAMRQNLRMSESGDYMEFDSAVFPGRVNRLDKLGRESISIKPDKRGRPRPPKKQKPALDHIVQYANIKARYGEMVTAERAKAARGRPRRNSLDLFTAFSGAVRTLIT